MKLGLLSDTHNNLGNLRQALAMSNGTYAIFYQRSVSAFFLAGALLLILLAFRPLIRKGIDWKWREQLTEADNDGR